MIGPEKVCVFQSWWLPWPQEQWAKRDLSSWPVQSSAATTNSGKSVSQVCTCQLATAIHSIGAEEGAKTILNLNFVSKEQNKNLVTENTVIHTPSVNQCQFPGAQSPIHFRWQQCQSQS